MQDFALWEIVVAIGLAALLIFLFRPGIKANLERGRDAPKDWSGALIPIALVALLVVFLIFMVQ